MNTSWNIQFTLWFLLGDFLNASISFSLGVTKDGSSQSNQIFTRESEVTIWQAHSRYLKMNCSNASKYWNCRNCTYYIYILKKIISTMSGYFKIDKAKTENANDSHLSDIYELFMNWSFCIILFLMLAFFSAV